MARHPVKDVTIIVCASGEIVMEVGGTWWQRGRYRWLVLPEAPALARSWAHIEKAGLLWSE